MPVIIAALAALLVVKGKPGAIQSKPPGKSLVDTVAGFIGGEIGSRIGGNVKEASSGTAVISSPFQYLAPKSNSNETCRDIHAAASHVARDAPSERGKHSHESGQIAVGLDHQRGSEQRATT